MNQDFWYGRGSNIGLKEQMKNKEIEDKNKRQIIIMESPVMTEEDQKNGKAAGVDGVKAEAMKTLSMLLCITNF